MNFLEKDLETIIWENYERCEERGLKINQQFYKHGKLYRQLNLAPYGIADLVCLRFFPRDKVFYAQVIELKKGKVDTTAYMQAKRYQTALANTLERLRDDMASAYTINIETIIIGNEVEMAGDFVFTLNGDFTCQAYTYSYQFEGIKFEPVGREWVTKGWKESLPLNQLEVELGQHMADAYKSYAAYVKSIDEQEQAHFAEFGDYSQALLITPEEVLLNTDLLALPEPEPEEGGEDGAN